MQKEKSNKSCEAEKSITILKRICRPTTHTYILNCIDGLWCILQDFLFSIQTNSNVTLREKKKKLKMYLNNKIYYSHVGHYLYFYLRMNLMKNSERKSLFNNVLKIPIIFQYNSKAE